MLRMLQFYGSNIYVNATSGYLAMQPGGNLVLYRQISAFSRSSGRLLATDQCPIWNSQTAGYDGWGPRLVLQNDGNLVIRLFDGAPIWWVSKPYSGFIQVG